MTPARYDHHESDLGRNLLGEQVRDAMTDSGEDFQSLRNFAVRLKEITFNHNHSALRPSADDERAAFATNAVLVFEAIAETAPDLQATVLRCAALEFSWPEWTRGTSGWGPPRELSLATTRFTANTAPESNRLLQRVLKAADIRQETLNLGIAANPLTPLDLLEELPLGQNYPTIVAAANPNANHELATLAIGAVSGVGFIDAFLARSNPDTGWVDDLAFEYVMQEVQISRSCIFWECLLHPDSPGVQELFDYDSPSDPEEWEGLLDDLTQCAERNRNIASLAYRSSWEPFRAAVGETPWTSEERHTDQMRSTPPPPLHDQEVETGYAPKPSDDRTQRQIPLELPSTD